MDASSREALVVARERLAERTQGAPGQSLLNLAECWLAGERPPRPERRC